MPRSMLQNTDPFTGQPMLYNWAAGGGFGSLAPGANNPAYGGYGGKAYGGSGEYDGPNPDDSRQRAWEEHMARTAEYFDRGGGPRAIQGFSVAGDQPRPVEQPRFSNVYGGGGGGNQDYEALVRGQVEFSKANMAAHSDERNRLLREQIEKQKAYEYEKSGNTQAYQFEERQNQERDLAEHRAAMTDRENQLHFERQQVLAAEQAKQQGDQHAQDALVRQELQRQAAEQHSALWDYQFTTQQKAKVAELNAARESVRHDESLDDTQKMDLLRQIDFAQAGIRPQPVPKERKPFPDGQNEGDTWTDQTGARVTRHNGQVHQLLKPHEVPGYQWPGVGPNGESMPTGASFIDPHSGDVVTISHQGERKLLGASRSDNAQMIMKIALENQKRDKELADDNPNHQAKSLDDHIDAATETFQRVLDNKRALKTGGEMQARPLKPPTAQEEQEAAALLQHSNEMFDNRPAGLPNPKASWINDQPEKIVNPAAKAHDEKMRSLNQTILNKYSRTQAAAKLRESLGIPTPLPEASPTERQAPVGDMTPEQAKAKGMKVYAGPGGYFAVDRQGHRMPLAQNRIEPGSQTPPAAQDAARSELRSLNSKAGSLTDQERQRALELARVLGLAP